MRQEFAEVITRKHFCTAVGIHATTLKRWERGGHLRPRKKRVLGIETMVFNEEDVETGKRAAELLAENPGVMSVLEAFQAARDKKR